MNTFDSIGFNFDMLCYTYKLRNYKSALRYIKLSLIYFRCSENTVWVGINSIGVLLFYLMRRFSPRIVASSMD
jgi:hypothetical protein